MTNNDNLVSAAIRPEDVSEMVRVIDGVRQKLTFLLELGEEDRFRLAKPGSEILDALPALATAAEANPQYFPADLFDAQEMLRDLNLAKNLEPLRVAVRALADGLEDTRLAALSDAYRTGLQGWVLLKAAVKFAPALNSTIDAMRQALDRRSRPRS